VTDPPAARSERGKPSSVPAIVATLALVAEAALALSATSLSQFANFQPVAASLAQGKLVFAVLAVVSGLWGAWKAKGRRRWALATTVAGALALAFV
jgi:hypothetical protein